MRLKLELSKNVRTSFSAQILHKNSLPTPAAFKTDLVVGYMFQGDISQLTVTNSTDSVSGQCSSTTQLIRDSELLNEKHSLKHKGVDYLEEEYVDLDWQPSSHTSQIFKQVCLRTQNTLFTLSPHLVR